LHWLGAPVMELALRRVDFHKLPRQSKFGPPTSFGDVLKNYRLERSLTQKQFADQFKLPIRIIRDLEQGKFSASLENTIKIFEGIGHRIVVE